MSLIFSLLYLIVLIFQFLLLIRIIYEVVQMLARHWRPRGIALILASVVYSVTDPPMRALRRVIHPVRLGGIALDLAFIVLWLITVILLAVLGSLV